MAMQFPGMTPLTYAAAPNYAQAAQGLGSALQKIAPKPAVPTAPAPMDISPAATNAGTNVPQPGLLDALKGMSPQSILDRLRAMSAGGQSVMPQGMPGSAALDSAGMLTPGPVAANPLGPVY
jgi:hypothetical protein